ncbi:MAG: sugar ABC transporter ATP-binding protein [Roseiarcus sp.]|jgi:ribose transport system ATP-binding protein/rhamnose transport system ATP-binding protein
MSALLEIDAVTKTFPGVKALEDVTFKVNAGLVHAVVGENGAGKSTLMQIVAGVQRPDAGRLVLAGEAIHLHNTRDALSKGIGIVFQELNLAPNMTVAENICLGVEPRTRRWFLDRRRQRRLAGDALARMGVGIDLDARVGDLAIAQQQLIEICKALIHNPRLLILDEPTSSLSDAETSFLFKVMAELKAAGVTMLYVSHRMQEIFSVCDDVTVLRDGRHVRTMPLSETTPEEVVRLMVGRDLSGIGRTAPADPGQPVVLSVRGLTREPAYRDISFDVHAGEIVAFAGLVGAGRSEVMLGIFGSPPPDRGKIMLDGGKVRIDRASTAIAGGISLMPEDRKRQGLVLGLPVGVNLSLAAVPRLARIGFIDMAAEQRLINDCVERFHIKTPDTARKVGQLSGGNQQKVVLAKWLATKPRVLIVDEPTRGVDVGSKAQIYAFLRELAAAGLAIVVVSSDLPEVLAISNRILVMRDGRLVGSLSGEEADEEKIMSLAALSERAEDVA